MEGGRGRTVAANDQLSWWKRNLTALGVELPAAGRRVPFASFMRAVIRHGRLRESHLGRQP